MGFKRKTSYGHFSLVIIVLLFPVAYVRAQTSKEHPVALASRKQENQSDAKQN